MRHLQLFALILGACIMALPVQGGMIISTGNNPQSDEENILFNEVGLVSLGNPVTGLTNQSDLLVTFTSDELLTTPSQGQARVEANDGSFTNYTIAVPGGTFLDYIFALNVDGNTSGTATIQANEVGGSSLTGTFSIGVGENFFTVLATDGQRLSSVQIETTVPLSDVRQNRISGAEADVPEPGSAFLLLGGFAAFAMLRFRRA